MSVLPKRLIGKQVTATATETSYTAPLGTRVRITAATVCNSDAATPYDLTVYKFASGGAAGADTAILNTKTIAAKDTYIISELLGHVLEPGDVIQAIASTTLKLNLFVSGVEITQ